jgi:hypothetical protein
MPDGEGNEELVVLVVGLVLFEFSRKDFDDIAGHAGFFGDN